MTKRRYVPNYRRAEMYEHNKAKREALWRKANPNVLPDIQDDTFF